jgi:hypothetical protein
MKQLPISERTVFLDVNGLRAARGININQVNELVESGKLLWVFNVGRQAGETHNRNLRFWLPEILDSSEVADLKLENVIQKILPLNRQNFNGSELCQWFLISRQTVHRLGQKIGGVVKNRVLRVERNQLADYLSERWIGATPVTEKGGKS